MKIGRRGFFKVAGATAGVGLLAAGEARASADEGALLDGPGVLVDTTLCVGCRACEGACSEANGLPAPSADDKVMESKREPAEQVFTVVNKSQGEGPERFAKKQCMHCIAPACASACLVQAMKKLPTGPVVYDASVCMGCRYCMIACPFDIPKYEYDSIAPRVRKCTFCAERQEKGLKPACTEVCPSGALTFGKRSQLLEQAKTRIYTNPGRYVHHVYGEHEAGGTSWLYLTDRPLEELALRADVPQQPMPGLVNGALGVPPAVMTLWPPLLMGIYAFSNRREKAAAEATDKKEDHHG
jgi:formate dehydrogenase iron-sulfur subunit